MPIFRNKLSIICAAIVLALVIGAFVVVSQWEKGHLDFSSDSEWEMADFIEHQGDFYALRDDVDTLLIMGVDKFADTAVSGAYNNDMCADFLLLVAIDHGNKTCSAVQINRDTMAEVSILGIGGKRTGTVVQQITLAHTYGTGGDDSCRNTVRAVSELFGGLVIDSYVCLTMDAVAELNDLVGGVSVTVNEDLTAIDPTFIKGETVTLMSDKALLYVRQRSGLEDSSNATRMERQKQYMQVLSVKLLDYLDEHDSLPQDTLSNLSAYTHSDYSTSELERVVKTASDYDFGEIYSISGSYSVGEYMEFVPDVNNLKQFIVDTFYKKR